MKAGCPSSFRAIALGLSHYKPSHKKGFWFQIAADDECHDLSEMGRTNPPASIETTSYEIFWKILMFFQVLPPNQMVDLNLLG
jgi:hypothetical protein